MANKAYKFRIYPNREQKTLFAKTFGCVRFIYNKMLDDKIKYYEKTKKKRNNTPAQYKKEMTRRKNAAARARKLTRLQERVGAVLAMLGFLMLLGAGGMCEIGQIIGYGLAGLFLFVFGVWLAHGFYGQADKAEWLRESV